jgi:hypothetical protein
MKTNTETCVVSTRLTATDRALLEALAASTGQRVSELLRSLVRAGIRERLPQQLGGRDASA